MPFLIGAGVAAPIAGGLIGQAASSGDRDKAAQDQQAALDAIKSVQSPQLQQILLQHYVSAGTITPEMAQSVSLGPSAMGGISTDPRLRDAQMNALAKMQQMGQGGLNDSDKLALQQINNQANQQSNSDQQAILQNMQQRGQGGSGAELAQKLMASQNASNQAQNQGMSVASQAQNRALQALAQSGQLGGQMQSQQFGQQAEQAKAADAIAAWNAQNQQATKNANTERSNQAQYYNLGQAQQIANANTGVGNQQTMYNQAQLPMAQYQANLQKAGALAGAYGQNAAYNQQQAQNTAQMWGGLGQAAGQGALGVANYNAYNKRTNAMYPGSSEGSSGSSAGTGGNYNLGTNTQFQPADFSGVANVAHGGEIPGEAKVDGDSEENDKVPAMLSPGEIVIPRSVAQAENPSIVEAFLKGIHAHKHSMKG